MCLGIPGEVLDVRDADGFRVGRVRFGGVTREVCLETVPEALPGDFVVVHVGMAIARLDREAAERALRLLERFGDTDATGTLEEGPEEEGAA